MKDSSNTPTRCSRRCLSCHPGQAVRKHKPSL